MSATRKLGRGMTVLRSASSAMRRSFGASLGRIRSIHRDQLREIIEILPLSFERIVRLAVIGLRRRRIEVAHRRVDQTSRNRNEEQNDTQSDAANLQEFAQGSPVSAFEPALMHPPLRIYDHRLEKVPKLRPVPSSVMTSPFHSSTEVERMTEDPTHIKRKRPKLFRVRDASLNSPPQSAARFKTGPA